MPIPDDENRYRMFPHSPIGQPIDPPATEPDAEPLVQLCFSREYVPYLLTALDVLCYADTFTGADEQKLLAANRFKLMTAMLMLAQEGCGVMFDLRLVGCELQKTLDGGETWSTLVDLTTCAEPGQPGQDGASAEMRVFGGYIQWRQSDDDPTWTNLIALADLQGEPGEPGQPGQDGADGQDCDCTPPLVTVPDQDIDQRWCNVAGFATYQVVREFINQVIIELQATSDPFAVISGWLNELAYYAQTPQQTAIAIAASLIASIFQSDLPAHIAEVQEALDDENFWENVQCAFFTAFITEHALTSTTVALAAGNIIDLDDGHTATQELIAQFLNDFGAAGLQGLVVTSPLVSYDCTGCIPCATVHDGFDDGLPVYAVADFWTGTAQMEWHADVGNPGGCMGADHLNVGGTHHGATLMLDLQEECTIFGVQMDVNTEVQAGNPNSAGYGFAFFRADHTYVANTTGSYAVGPVWKTVQTAIPHYNVRFVRLYLQSEVASGVPHLDNLHISRGEPA